MIKRSKRSDTFVLEFTLSSDVTSSITASSSEEEPNPNWKYDPWEIRFLTERIKKKREKQGINHFFDLREQRKIEKNMVIPPINLKRCTFSSSQDTISPKSKPPMVKNIASLSQDSIVIYRIRKKDGERVKVYKIHRFSSSTRLHSRERERTFLHNKSLRKRETGKKRKGWKSLALSGHRASKSLIKVRKGQNRWTYIG